MISDWPRSVAIKTISKHFARMCVALYLICFHSIVSIHLKCDMCESWRKLSILHFNKCYEQSRDSESDETRPEFRNDKRQFAFLPFLLSSHSSWLFLFDYFAEFQLWSIFCLASLAVRHFLDSLSCDIQKEIIIEDDAHTHIELHTVSDPKKIGSHRKFNRRLISCPAIRKCSMAGKKKCSVGCQRP